MRKYSLSHESLGTVCNLWRASRLSCLSARLRLAKSFLSEGLCWSRQPLLKASSTGWRRYREGRVVEER